MGKVSRKSLVLLTAICFALSGVLIPVGAHLPRWIEAEIVLAVWWLVWVFVMAYLLFNGHKVDDDRNVVPFRSGKSGAVMPDVLIEGAGCAFEGGCETLLAGLLCLILIGLGLFVLIEFLIPAVALLLMASVGGMLARAVNDREGCYGRAGLSLLWGAIWSTLYIGPAAAVILWLATFFPHPHQ